MLEVRLPGRRASCDRASCRRRAYGTTWQQDVRPAYRARRRVPHLHVSRIVIDQVLVTECDAENALAQQAGHRMADRGAGAHFGDALREPPAEPDRPIRRHRQPDAVVRGDGTGVKSAHKSASTGASQIKLGVATPCRRRDHVLLRSSRSRKTIFLSPSPDAHHCREKFGPRLRRQRHGPRAANRSGGATGRQRPTVRPARSTVRHDRRKRFTFARMVL